MCFTLRLPLKNTMPRSPLSTWMVSYVALLHSSLMVPVLYPTKPWSHFNTRIGLKQKKCVLGPRFVNNADSNYFCKYSYTIDNKYYGIWTIQTHTMNYTPPPHSFNYFKNSKVLWVLETIKRSLLCNKLYQELRKTLN